MPISARHERCPCCRAVWPVVAMWPDGERWLLDCPLCGPVVWRAVLTIDDYASVVARDLLSRLGRTGDPGALPGGTVAP